MFSIEFPANAVHVSTARIFSGAIARHFGADAADIEDLKIALTEACGSAISHARRRTEPVRVAAVPGGGMLTFEVNGHRRAELLNRGSPDGEPNTTEEHMIALSAELIGALFPEAEFIDKPEGTFFRLSVLADGAL